MAVGDAYVFPGFLTPVLTQLFFPKPPTTFLTCLCRGERRKYAGKKSPLDWGSNSQPQGHESDTLTTEPPRRGPWKEYWRSAEGRTSHYLVSNHVRYPLSYESLAAYLIKGYTGMFYTKKKKKSTRNKKYRTRPACAFRAGLPG